jgi:hypothetical protein
MSVTDALFQLGTRSACLNTSQTEEVPGNAGHAHTGMPRVACLILLSIPDIHSGRTPV